MKCVVTHEETNTHTNGIPLSKKGRDLLEEIIAAHNKKISDFFVEKTLADNPESTLTGDSLRRFAPSINKKRALNLLKIEESDIMETRAEVLEE